MTTQHNIRLGTYDKVLGSPPADHFSTYNVPGWSIRKYVATTIWDMPDQLLGIDPVLVRVANNAVSNGAVWLKVELEDHAWTGDEITAFEDIYGPGSYVAESMFVYDVRSAQLTNAPVTTTHVTVESVWNQTLGTFESSRKNVTDGTYGWQIAGVGADGRFRMFNGLQQSPQWTIFRDPAQAEAAYQYQQAYGGIGVHRLEGYFGVESGKNFIQADSTNPSDPLPIKLLIPVDNIASI